MKYAQAHVVKAMKFFKHSLSSQVYELMKGMSCGEHLGSGIEWLLTEKKKTESPWVDPHLEELCPRNSWAGGGGEDNLFPVREQPTEEL